MGGAALTADGDALRCPDAHRYPIRGGIPRFVAGPTYADAFGLQWNAFPRTQLDSQTGLPISKDRLRSALGPLWEHLSGSLVLEAGCGAGRFTEILLARGARVLSVDLTSAVEANAGNFPIDPRHRIAQADLTDLPFPPARFDIVLCLGVLQHLPSPEEGLAALSGQVRPGGALVVDHYRRSLGWYVRTAPLVRLVLRRLPPATSAVLTRRLVDLFLPLHRLLRGRRILTKLLIRVSPVIAYYDAQPMLSDDMQRQWALLDTYDSLTDYYKHFRTSGMIARTLAGLGLSDIVCTENRNVVVARAIRGAD